MSAVMEAPQRAQPEQGRQTFLQWLARRRAQGDRRTGSVADLRDYLREMDEGRR